MPSSFSTDLKLELMVTGENAGTWGTKTNDNLNVLQQAIAGFKAISIAGGAQTTALLINNSPDIATSDARNAVIKLTGTITGNQIVTVPDGIEKTYIVQNGTTGAFTVQFKTAGGTGVTFASTNKGFKIVYSDGTNIVDVELSSVNPIIEKILDTNGNEEIIFTATTSAVNELTIANAATGNNPNISASGSDTNIGITLTPKGTGGVVIPQINDTNNNEEIKFTATASAVNELTIANAATGNSPTISATGSDTNIGINLTPKGTGGIVLPAGAVATPALTTSGDLNTGIYFPSADTIAFTEGGTEAMRIDSSGSVGIRVTPSIYWGGNFALDVGAPGCGITSRQNRELSMCQNAAFNKYAANGTASRIDMGNDSVIAFLNAASGTAGDTISFSERMRITTAGALCVGGSNANGPSIISSTSASSGTACYANLNTAGAGSHFHYFINSTNSAIIGSITNNGNTGTAFNTSSDYRLKENVNYNFDATTRLKQLKPARFNFIASPNKTVDGFLAHEVQDIIPEAITGTKDQTLTKEKVVINSNGGVIAENIEQADWEAGKIPNEEGKSQYPVDSTWEASKVVPVYQGIDQAKLTPILTKALQEAIAKIEQLESRLTTLENNNV